MEIDVNEKTSSKPKAITILLYNNATARLYLLNSEHTFDNDAQVDTLSLKKIRNSCFWGVASAK
ncbi:MAG: hypothetical protein JWR02_892 [Mucilaginibacter sp.]|nr:hypothetical protein [Mucilaginibacter sp.]